MNYAVFLVLDYVIDNGQTRRYEVHERRADGSAASRAAARQEIDREIDTYYGPLKLQHHIVVGPVAEIADVVMSYGEVDCQQVVLFCPGSDVGRLEQLAEVATVVKPAVPIERPPSTAGA